MRSSSARRVFDYARTGTYTLIQKAQVANRKAKQVPLIAAAGALLIGTGLWVRSCLNEQARIANMLDPAGTCDNYRSEHILETVTVSDERAVAMGFTTDDVKNILAAIDYRFTSGLSRVRIVGDLRSVRGKGIVAGRYNNEDQSFAISNNVVGQRYFKLVETIFHEVGHHIYWKLKAKGHDAVDGFGDNLERFAQVFASYSLSSVLNDWRFFNPYQLDPPKPAEIEWLKKNIFCGRDPAKWLMDNPHALSVTAKLYLELGDFEKLAEALNKLSDLPENPLMTPDLQNIIALKTNRLFRIDPLHLIADLRSIRSILDQVRITPDQLLGIAEYFRGFGNIEFAEALTAFTAALR